MKTIDDILLEVCEDKYQNLSTTSFQFKRDLWNFFADNTDCNVVEFGTHKGQTTRVLSFLFNKVYTINNNNNEAAKELNSDRNNIVYVNMDLYSTNKLNIDDTVDVILIDAGHQFDQVIQDINRAFTLNCSTNCYIVFDDYGLNIHREHVRRAVDFAVNSNYLSIVKYIGHPPGHTFGTGNKGGMERVLEKYEGVITKINWSDL